MTRKAFPVTDEVREQVRTLAARGVRQEDIAGAIGCRDAKTLRKHFRDELDRGTGEANAKVAGALYEKAVGGDTIAQIFWMKTRAGWREKVPEKPIPVQEAAQTDNVIVLPDNNRDPELTEELRKTQNNYYVKKQRRQSRNPKEKSESDQ
jgi:hypothetical protein